ncbi:MAG TPA: DUF885 domain-containing protein, partial [Acidimicrobiia bacterium]|nr:DUF885 domain-containing protein [Acidimicrobiia bacterium]
MTEVYDIADQYVERSAALDPCRATYAGIKGYDDQLTDFSPEGIAARLELARATVAALDVAPRHGDDDRIAADVMRDRLDTSIALHDAGEDLRPLRVIGSPLQTLRQTFDLMSYESDDDWAVAAARLARMPEALRQFEATLREGMARNILPARRQALACAQQAAAWGGDQPFFRDLAARRPEDAVLAEAADLATSAYAALGRFLRDTYAPACEDRDPVGRERYAVLSRSFNGIDLDFEETYAWGWDELYRIEAALRDAADRILPGSSIDEAIEHLNRDPARSMESVDAFVGWNQELIDRTISE